MPFRPPELMPGAKRPDPIELEGAGGITEYTPPKHSVDEPKSGTPYDDETEEIFRSLQKEYEIDLNDSSSEPPRYDKKEVDLMNYFRPYISGERSLSHHLSDPVTAPRAIELLRQAYAYYRYNVKGGMDNWEMRSEIMYESEGVFLPDVFSEAVTQSLEALTNEYWQLGRDEGEARRLKVNILYLVSEALDSPREEDRKKLELWLEQHWDSMMYLDDVQVFHGTDGEEIEDAILLLAKENIIARVTNEDRVRELLKEKFHKEEVYGYYTPQDLERLEYDGVPDIVSSSLSISGGHFSRRKALTAEILVEGFGFDKKIVNKWQEARVFVKKDERGQDVYTESYARNFWEMFYLEKEQPGSAKRLFQEFGIANFSRYDRDMLLRQLKMADQNVPYGLVIYPEADWNGAFFQTDKELVEASLKLRTGGFETRIVEAGSQRELARRLLRLHKKYALAGHKFSFAIVGGHGSEKSLSLGNPKPINLPPLRSLEQTEEAYEAELEIWDSIQSNDTGDFVSSDLVEGEGINRALEDWFVLDAPKVLVSCSTGVEGGFAETASASVSGEVIAPKIPTNVRKIDVSFDENGRPKFLVEYSKGEASRYVAGKSKE